MTKREESSKFRTEFWQGRERPRAARSTLGEAEEGQRRVLDRASRIRAVRTQASPTISCRLKKHQVTSKFLRINLRYIRAVPATTDTDQVK
jgi:hypothetical protein